MISLGRIIIFSFTDQKPVFYVCHVWVFNYDYHTHVFIVPNLVTLEHFILRKVSRAQFVCKHALKFCSLTKKVKNVFHLQSTPLRIHFGDETPPIANYLTYE